MYSTTKSQSTNESKRKIEHGTKSVRIIPFISVASFGVGPGWMTSVHAYELFDTRHDAFLWS